MTPFQDTGSRPGQQRKDRDRLVGAKYCVSCERPQKICLMLKDSHKLSSLMLDILFIICNLELEELFVHSDDLLRALDGLPAHERLPIMPVRGYI